MIRRDAGGRQLIENTHGVRRGDPGRLGQIGQNNFASGEERARTLTARMVARLVAVRRRGRISRRMMARIVSVVIVMGALIGDCQVIGVNLQVPVMCAAADDDMSRQYAGGDNRHDLPRKSHASHILSVSKYRPHFRMGQVKLCRRA
jgi:hypothetical protein